MGSLLATQFLKLRSTYEVGAAIHVERDDCALSYCNNGRPHDCYDSWGFTACSYRGMAPALGIVRIENGKIPICNATVFPKRSNQEKYKGISSRVLLSK